MVEEIKAVILMVQALTGNLVAAVRRVVAWHGLNLTRAFFFIVDRTEMVSKFSRVLHIRINLAELVRQTYKVEGFSKVLVANWDHLERVKDKVIRAMFRILIRFGIFSYSVSRSIQWYTI